MLACLDKLWDQKQTLKELQSLAQLMSQKFRWQSAWCMVNGFVDSLLHDALECADLAHDCSQAVLSLPDYATPQAGKLVNAQHRQS